MAWINSLSPADIAELKELRDRAPADVDDFSYYIFLTITVRALGPIPLAEMSAYDDHIWKDLYHDQFELRSDGCVHLKRSLALVS